MTQEGEGSCLSRVKNGNGSWGSVTYRKLGVICGSEFRFVFNFKMITLIILHKIMSIQKCAGLATKWNMENYQCSDFWHERELQDAHSQSYPPSHSVTIAPPHTPRITLPWHPTLLTWAPATLSPLLPLYHASLLLLLEPPHQLVLSSLQSLLKHTLDEACPHPRFKQKPAPAWHCCALCPTLPPIRMLLIPS